MTRTLNTSTSVGGESSAIQKPGTYHCTITHAADGESTKGNPMSGVCAVLSVLDGTEEGQKEKEFKLHLFDPDLSKGESSQEWATKKQTAYGVAINQVDPSKLGESAECDFGEAAIGQQIIINLAESEHEGKKKLELNYANIYHVDDPRAANFPKDKEALALLPKEFRKPAEYFDAISGKAKVAPAMKPKGISDDDLNDL